MSKFYIFILLIFVSINASAQLKTKLPIVIINTEGKTILDDPKITANMQIIHNNNDDYNLETEPANEYDGLIGIELRGSSSQMFPKKPYGLETRDISGNDLDVSLFGWPEESDWILFASYHEKSLMHNVLTLELARQMGTYASRTKYVELIVDGDYKGVYVFMEKVKRSKGRVDIAKLKNIDIEGEQLTGGYIFKVDKSTGSRRGGWTSQQANNNSSPPFFAYFQYEYPKAANNIQKAYIQNYMDEFEFILSSIKYDDPLNGYRKYIEVESFVKYFLLNEVSRNIDGYRISTFLYKDKGEKLVIGPPWDYDISYGNANYCQGDRYDRWAYRFNYICPGDGLQVPFWWERLLSDNSFVHQLRKYYFDERENGVLSQENIYSVIDSLQNLLEEPQKRNFERWPILGTFVWPNPSPIASTWLGEVDELKAWVENRLNWMDRNFPNIKMIVEDDDIIKEKKIIAFPNPFETDLSLRIDLPRAVYTDIRIFDGKGSLIFDRKYFLEAGKNDLMIKESDLNINTNGLFVVQIITGDDIYNQKVLKF